MQPCGPIQHICLVVTNSPAQRGWQALLSLHHTVLQTCVAQLWLAQLVPSWQPPVWGGTFQTCKQRTSHVSPEVVVSCKHFYLAFKRIFKDSFLPEALRIDLSSSLLDPNVIIIRPTSLLLLNCHNHNNNLTDYTKCEVHWNFSSLAVYKNDQ